MEEKEKLLAEALGRVESLQAVVRSQEQEFQQLKLERSTGISTELAAMQKNRDEWKQRAAAAEQDSKRLDWLLNPQSDGLVQVFSRPKNKPHDWQTVFNRQAIDTAMKEENK